MARGPRSRRVWAILALLILTASSLVVAAPPAAAQTSSSSTQAGSSKPQQLLLFDDFTKDSSLDSDQWQINGPVGSLFGPDDVGDSCQLTTLEPGFSSNGMEVSEVTEKCEIVTVQSVASFTPPFNATAVVAGTVSNGHTFVFAMSSADASSGVSIIGNLNSENCSNLGDCGDPTVCGNPFNSTISPGACYYGIDVKTGAGGGGWAGAGKLYLTPSLNVFYTLQIIVSASGSAKFSVSVGGDVLGRSTATVGMGPFYIVMEQAEGGPVSGKGPNEAYWKYVSLTSTPTTLAVYPTESAFTSIKLTYDPTSTSPIHVAVVKDQSYPDGLTVTLRPAGTATFNDALNIQPSPSGTTTVQVNATLDCLAGNCMKPGGTQLPSGYNLTVTSSDGSYSQDATVRLTLLQAKWLVMVYCASDSILQGSLGANVGQMERTTKANDNPAVGMLVLFYYFYGAGFSGNAAQPGGTIALYRVANGTLKQMGGVWPQTSMYDPATLSKFLSTAMSMVPAARNQLILSGHGGGIEGYGGGGPATTMTITQLATALSGSSPKLDILSFDACLMAQTEVLYQLRGYASYFTASERTEPKWGYNYTGFTASLLKDPDQSTVSYLSAIVSSYLAKYSPPSPYYVSGMSPTLSAIDSSQLAGLVSGLNTLSVALVRDYGDPSQRTMTGPAYPDSFNYTMLSVLRTTVAADADEPYLDVRSLAQNILADPKITDQSVRAAASALIQDAKAAVIANTTSPVMYEGLTVLLFPTYGTGVLLGGRVTLDARLSQYYTGLEAQLGFSSAANWSPLLQDVYRSNPVWSGTSVTLNHPAHQLYLNVYNSTGGHTGYNAALLNVSSTGIEVIPGSYYLDFGNGTTVITLPPGVQNFTVVVDGTSMEEANESYTLTYAVVQNGTVTSTRTVQGAIDRDTLQSAPATIQNGILTVGSATVTTSTTSATPTTSSATSTASPSSTSSASSSLIAPSALAGVLVVAAVLAATVISARRRSLTRASGSPIRP
ncbi:MAG: clostripain-related cysteine peptidase [Nitrososphaerales archaeon]|jgi:hypothetical protein